MGFQRGYILSLIALVHSTLLYAQCNSAGELGSLNVGSNGYEYPSHFSSEHQYASLGFERERMLPSGISQSFAYDNIGRLVDSKTRQSTKVRRERRYHWGKAAGQPHATRGFLTKFATKVLHFVVENTISPKLNYALKV